MVAMNKSLRQPSLSPEQMKAVRCAAATLRPSGRDAFLQDLARELARQRPPLSDHAVLDAIRHLLGLVAVKNFVLRGD
jgi:hypothetical protein